MYEEIILKKENFFRVVKAKRVMKENGIQVLVYGKDLDWNGFLIRPDINGGVTVLIQVMV